jgi:hypothetical protein
MFYFVVVELMRKGRKFFSEYKTTYRSWVNGILVLNVIKAKDAEVIIEFSFLWRNFDRFCFSFSCQFILSHSKNVNKSVVYRFLNSFIGTGLLTADGMQIHRA